MQHWERGLGATSRSEVEPETKTEKVNSSCVFVCAGRDGRWFRHVSPGSALSRSGSVR